MTIRVASTTELDQFREAANEWLGSVFPARQADDWAEFLRPRTLAERQAEADRGRRFQNDLFDAGYAGIGWPEKFGGQGLSAEYEVAFRDATEPFDLSALHPLRVGIGQCGPTILEFGTAEQKATYIEPLLSGRHIWCQLFSEPNAGSDVANIQTRATPDGAGYVISGQKTWTSGADLSDFGLIVARTEEGSERHSGLSMFVVDMHAPGVSVRPIRQMTGATNFCEVFLDDVTVGMDQLVGEVGQGWAAAMYMLTSERRSIGQRRGFIDQLETFVRFAAESPTEHPGRSRDVDAVVSAEIARLLSIRTQLSENSSSPVPAAASLVKLAVNRATKAIAAAATERIGANALAWDEADPHEIWRLLLVNSPGSSIAAGSDEIQRNIISERALGLPKG